MSLGHESVCGVTHAQAAAYATQFCMQTADLLVFFLLCCRALLTCKRVQAMMRHHLQKRSFDKQNRRINYNIPHALYMQQGQQKDWAGSVL